MRCATRSSAGSTTTSSSGGVSFSSPDAIRPPQCLAGKRHHIAKHEALARDLVAMDHGAVRHGARLEHRQRARELGSLAHVLEKNHVVSQMRDGLIRDTLQLKQ